MPARPFPTGRLLPAAASALTVAAIAATRPSPAAASAQIPRAYSVAFIASTESSIGEDLNDRGQVVGVDANTAFWWEDGAMHTLGPGVATGIDHHGQIAGFTQTDGVSSFAWTSCTTCETQRPLPSLGGRVSEAWAINDRGDVAGVSSPPTSTGIDLHPVVWRDDTVVDINAQGGNVTRSGIANDINDRGDVVGSTIFTNGVERNRGFLYRRGVLSELVPLGGAAATSIAAAVNHRGDVAGSSTFAPGGPPHATVWGSDGLPRDLGTLPDGDRSTAEDVNDAGLVVGVAAHGSGEAALQTGFVSDGTRMVDLSEVVPDGVHISWASAINDRGQITGAASPGGAVLLTPVR